MIEKTITCDKRGCKNKETIIEDEGTRPEQWDFYQDQDLCPKHTEELCQLEISNAERITKWLEEK